MVCSSFPRSFAMTSSNIDQLVKGSTPSGSPPDLRPASTTSTSSSSTSSRPPSSSPAAPSHSSLLASPEITSSSVPPDPLSTLPSSPPQIYLNLLILESSLRAQYLALRERRRQNTFFLLLLAAWITYFVYALFLRPREDGRGVGGSVYWVVEMGEKVALLGGVVTALLVWGTGQWERGIRWPRRWLAVANRGLRTMNTKIVIIRGPWWQELLSYLSFLFPFSRPFFPPPTGDFRLVDRHLSDKRGSRPHYPQYYSSVDDESGLVEEDLSSGGDYIRLLLLPKSFSPEFRENWDDYRADFWEKENERRAQLRQKVQERERQLAQQDKDRFWWLSLAWKPASSLFSPSVHRRRPTSSGGTPSKFVDNTLHHRPHHHHHGSINSKHALDVKPQSRRSTRSDSHSRTPSRSTTPVDADERPPSRSSATGRPRRTSTTTSTPSTPSRTTDQGAAGRRKKGSPRALGSRGLSPLTQAQVREGVHSTQSDDWGYSGGKEDMKDHDTSQQGFPSGDMQLQSS